MPRGRKKADNTAEIGFEQQIWSAADKLRGNIDASEYKNVFWVPANDRWDVIAGAAHTPEIGKVIDNVMRLIGRRTTSSRAYFPKNFSLMTSGHGLPLFCMNSLSPSANLLMNSSEMETILT